MSFHVPNDFRIRLGRLGSDDSFGNNGAFKLKLSTGEPCYIIASDKAISSKDPAWEHVSVSMKDRDPTWMEMCEVKAIFWDDEDCVVQYHPPKSDYVNIHPHCLHLWSPVGFNILRPPSIMVGPK